MLKHTAKYPAFAPWQHRTAAAAADMAAEQVAAIAVLHISRTPFTLPQVTSAASLAHFAPHTAGAPSYTRLLYIKCVVRTQ